MLLGTGITIKVLIFIYSKESGIWGRALQSKDFQLHFCFSSWATIYFHGKSDPLFPSGIKRGFLTRKLTFSKLPSQRVQIQTDKDSWTHEETPRANRYTAYSKCKLLHTNTELAWSSSTAHHQLCNTIRGSTQHPQHGQRGALPVTAMNKRRSWAILLATGGWLVGFLFRKGQCGVKQDKYTPQIVGLRNIFTVARITCRGVACHSFFHTTLLTDAAFQQKTTS